MRRPPLPLVLLLVLPSVFAGGAAFALVNWRSPSHIQVQLSADRILFRVNGAEPIRVLNSVAIRSVTLENYSRLEMTPDRGETADTEAFSSSQEAPESAWKLLHLTVPVGFTAGEASLHSSITLEPAHTRSSTLGMLDQVWAKPGTQVTMDSSDPTPLRAAIKFSGQPTQAIVSIPESFTVFSDYAQVTGIDAPSPQPDSQAFRFHLRASSPQAQVTGAANSLGLFITLPDGKPPAVFSPDPIPIDALEFTRQSSQGNVESTITSGELTFPDDPKTDPVKLNPGDYLTLEELSQFRIGRIELDPAAHGLRSTADGFAGVVRTGSFGFAQDRRLTYFDRLRHNPLLLLLFSVVAWVFPTTVGGYKLYKELYKELSQ